MKKLPAFESFCEGDQVQDKWFHDVYGNGTIIKKGKTYIDVEFINDIIRYDITHTRNFLTNITNKKSFHDL